MTREIKLIRRIKSRNSQNYSLFSCNVLTPINVHCLQIRSCPGTTKKRGQKSNQINETVLISRYILGV